MMPELLKILSFCPYNLVFKWKLELRPFQNITDRPQFLYMASYYHTA